MATWLVIDSETTGLLQPWSCMAELAAVLVVDGQGVAAFTSLIHPDILDDRAEEGLRINHLTREELLAAPPRETVVTAFATWARQLPADTQVTAYNAPFDRQHCERLGLVLPSWGPCIMQRARRHFGAKSLKLAEAAFRCDVTPYEPAHRALSDAYTAAAILVALDAAEQEQQEEAEEVKRTPEIIGTELIAMQQAPRTPRLPVLQFDGEYRYLSNFYLCPVQIYGWTFPSVEHAFQAMKSNNPAKEWPYFLKGTPGAAKKLGRAIHLRSDWEQVKVAIMRALVYDKFTRNPELGAKLKETWDAPLVEGNVWGDCYWGVCNGVGENRLGETLMGVREELFKLSPF